MESYGEGSRILHNTVQFVPTCTDIWKHQGGVKYDKIVKFGWIIHHNNNSITDKRPVISIFKFFLLFTTVTHR